MAYYNNRRRGRRYSSRSRAGSSTQWVRSLGILTATTVKDATNLLGTMNTSAPELSNRGPEVEAYDVNVVAPADSLVERVHLELTWLDVNRTQSCAIGVLVHQASSTPETTVPGPYNQANSASWMYWGWLTPYANGYVTLGGATGSENTSQFNGCKVIDVKSRRLLRLPLMSVYLVAEPKSPAQGPSIMYSASVLLRTP